MDGEHEWEAFESLCVRYMSGECSNEERRELVLALRAQEKREFYDGMQAAWNAVRPPRTPFDAAAAFERLKLSGDEAHAGVPRAQRR